eukprot:TRINITY_DN3179_c0_g1_i1.p1 TRINITY_DN3179_c0_g1~~TRINITY_DN3179_c0_g1_i1.p1  ORF type:complete len:896 (-),score=247.08 TRINITY_DN3179_c0_g1_i1:70-2757(-)
MAMAPLYQVARLCLYFIQVVFLLWVLWGAYEIRLYPITDFGMIIHEFDPWFNYRATEYLAEHGLSKFFKWYDYESWYPLGRPIGTTIYPGMQMTAVAIWEGMKSVGSFDLTLPGGLNSFLNSFFKYLNATSFGKMYMRQLPKLPKTMHFDPMSVNDICCLIPCWFGALAALFCGLMAYEISRSRNAFVITTAIMAIIPAGLMRSVGGEFDNEAVAMTAICAAFYFWMRSVRTPSSWPFGVLAGLAYINMVWAWGGYIFVLNMIGVHAMMLVLMGRFNSGVHKAYTLFFVIGTAGAMQIPVVGMQPLRSLEQMGPLLVFVGYQFLAFCDVVRRNKQMDGQEFVVFRIKVLAFMGACLLGVAILLWPTGYFGPLSSRIRGLFVKHTKTGNPLVDSVAEHQPASSGMYSSYLSLPLDYAYMGAIVAATKRNNGFYFMVLYGFIAEHFSGKMSRLVLICAPIVSLAAGIFAGFIMDLTLEPFWQILGKQDPEADKEKEKEKEKEKDEKKEAPTSGKEEKNNGKQGAGKAKKAAQPPKKSKKSKEASKWELEEWEEEERPGGAMMAKRWLKTFLADSFEENLTQFREMKSSLKGGDSTAKLYRLGGALAFICLFLFVSSTPLKIAQFVRHCDNVAQSLSNPQVVYKVPQRNGEEILVDDYYRGYLWIDDNTPKDARVMAWWDYGYQITGIARRTSIADGNTWNHEHIATLGRTLTSPEKKAWNTIRHLADYVLVWAGGSGDDLAKSPHLARIGNSVFPDHCGDDDPKCNKFGFYGDGSPTPMMAKSLLYKMVKNGMGAKVDPRLFQEVHTTKYGLMRVYKVMNVSDESKAWIADPANRVCDAPGSWYCVGQYPPALEKLIEKRRNFAQLEDFNKKGAKSAYTKLIEEELHGKRGGGSGDL